MPRNQFQRMVFAFLTVLVTVHGYVFYSLYVVNGSTLMQINDADSVLHAINAQGGVYMFGNMLPIWAVIVIEFCCAYIFECVIGSPLSFKMACKMFDPRKNHPMIFETVSLLVDSEDNSIKVDLAIRTAPRYGITEKKATKLSEEILFVVRDNWERLAKE